MGLQSGLGSQEAKRKRINNRSSNVRCRAQFQKGLVTPMHHISTTNARVSPDVIGAYDHLKVATHSFHRWLPLAAEDTCHLHVICNKVDHLGVVSRTKIGSIGTWVWAIFFQAVVCVCAARSPSQAGPPSFSYAKLLSRNFSGSSLFPEVCFAQLQPPSPSLAEVGVSASVRSRKLIILCSV